MPDCAQDADRTLTYSSYLRLEELLAQQQSLSGEHDELLFIIIHQVYELWFKEMLHELRAAQQALADGRTAHALALFKRVLTILKTLVAQIDVLETMTPLSFNAFRTRLGNSSGFQSVQFRELEFLLGRRDSSLLNQWQEGSPEWQRLRQVIASPSLHDSFLGFLAGQGWAVPKAALERDAAAAPQASTELQQLLLAVYREQGSAAQICERLVDMDEGLQEWRYRHVKMVERTIGGKPGTGGSSGAAYLRSTLFQPLFPDLWAIRSQL